MSLISLNKINKAFGGKQVLENVSCVIPARHKVGLVGENGSGKSTILKIIAGEIAPDSGEVGIGGGLCIWYAPQLPQLPAGRTAYQETLFARPEIAALHEKMDALEAQLTGHSDDELSVALGEVTTEFAAAGGYQFETETHETLRALGIGEETAALSVEQLSGGERARVALAQALLSEASVLLLDEPDNHLDLDGILWLEETLRRYSGTVLLVTHDRELLDRVADSIIEIEGARVTQQQGKFADFLRRKQDRLELQKRQYLEQQRELKQLKTAARKAEERARSVESRTIDFHYRKRALKVAKQAVNLRQRIERKLQSADHLEKPREERDKIRVNLTAANKRGALLRLDNIGKSYGNRVLFSGVDLELSRGQRIAIIGPNGAGKTTLLEIALGLQPPREGTVWLSPAAKWFYCDQHQAGLAPELSPYAALAQHTGLERTQIYYLLARLLFADQAFHQPIGSLSGGERTRLVLALLMNAQAELLLLDEPTNHLDWVSIEILGEALQTFPGAALLVSHDRRLISTAATQVLELNDGVLTEIG